MSKLVVINLGNGELDKGFEQVTARLWEVGNSLPEQFIGSLPPAPELAQLYRNWQLNYQSLCTPGLRSRSFDEDDEIEIDATGITNVSNIDFNELSQKLQQYLNDWLKSVEFLNIDRKLRSALNSTEEIRVIIETNHILLRRLPWYCWDFFDDYPKAAMALSQLEYQRIASSRVPKFPREKVRILAVLGNSQNIDLEAEARFLESLQDAQVEFLVKPSRTTFNNYLWDSEGWDILFFAGHSKTEGETGRIYINENETNNNLTIEQLKEALKQAIAKGLKLAIFNSCDGLGLADELQRLHIPAIIVMREPVPNLIAQEFFQYFLQCFAIEQFSLYLSVKQARKKLQGLENEFPGASWLPVICQNPGVAPPSWSDLGRRPTKISPYRGLFAFREKDARFFFGRETFTQMLVNAVQNQQFVAVVGSSGSGKSSVVFAGLVKQLRDTGEWHIIDFRPGSRPLFNLATALVSQQEAHNQRTERLREIRNLATDLQDCENGLRDFVDNILSENPNRHFLLVADQFEELYTLCRDSQERKAFLDRLLETIYYSYNFTLVITLRADFLGQALSYRPFADALQYADLKLGPMTDSELEATVEKPAELLGVTIEEKLIERILSTVSGEPGDLPLLEFALTQLWAKQQDVQLTHAAYNEIGGVEAALAHYAREIYDQLNFEEQERAQRIFIQLLHPGLGTEDTRRVATRNEVGAENWDLVARLADARLVVTGYDETNNLGTVEIVHEALIRNWGQLREWMHQDRDFRHWQEQLRVAMRTWESSNFDEGALLRGKPLRDAEDWQSKRFIELGALERSFIGLSVELREREDNNQKRRRRFTYLVLSGGLIAALSLAGIAWWQSQNSVKNEIKALSASSEAFLSLNHEFDALIAAISTRRKLQNFAWVDSDIKNQALKNLEQAAHRVVESNRLSKHSNSVWAVAFSPDGKVIASASADKNIKLWNRDGKELKTLKGHIKGVWAVAFSPDGKIIASASADNTIKLWNRDGTKLNTLRGHNKAVRAVAFSPNGKTIASASADSTIKLWNLNGKQLNTLEGHNDEIWAVAFSPDSKTIASASADGTIKLWNLNGKQLNTLEGHHTDKVYSVTFSPDGKTIASASADNTIKLWSLDGKELNTLKGHNDTVWAVAFSPDGKKIASASWDNTVNLWNRNGKLLKTLEGHSDRVRGVAFSPDSKTIASASEDKTVKLWKLDNGLLKVLRGHNKGVIGVRFSPDGKTIASASDDRTIKLWNRDGSLRSTLKRHTAGVLGVDFSPDGKMIASASDDKTIKLWKSNGTWLRDFKGHNKGVWGVAFSPDGKKIASAGMDNTIKIWDINGKLLNTLREHSNEVRKVIFSPDGKTIASTSLDKTVKLWKLDGTLLHTLPHADSVLSVSFSPDSKTIASAGLDSSIKLWKINGQLTRDFKADSDGVRGISFSPDGKIIASAGGDNNIKLWNSNGILLATLRGHEKGLREVSFSPDNTIASAGEDKIVILWSKDDVLRDPLVLGCNWVRDYLKNYGHVDKDLQQTRTFCEKVALEK